MAKVLFATWSGGGNVPPALALATELASRGDTVRFIGHNDQRDLIEKSGFEFEPYQSGAQWRGAVDTNILAAFAMWTDHRLGADVVASVRARPVDYLVVDCMLLGVLSAAQRKKLRTISFMHSYLQFFHQWRRNPLTVVFSAARRLKPLDLWDAADALVVTALPQLDGASGEPGGNRVWVGPMVAPESRPSTGTAVLVSLSTTNMPGQGAVLQRVLDALAGLAVELIVTTGPAIDRSDLRIPDGAEVHDYLPHVEAMSRARLVIGHGGHGTTMQALAHGLPLVLLPLHPMIDQPMVARSVEQAGAGIHLKMKAQPPVIAAAVQKILGDASYSHSAEALGSSIRSHSAAAKAADAIAARLALV